MSAAERLQRFTAPVQARRIYKVCYSMSPEDSIIVLSYRDYDAAATARAALLGDSDYWYVSDVH